MTDDPSAPIPPALTAEEWKRRITISEACDRYSEAAVIALANAALPDDDSRKITWAMVEALRGCAGDFETSSKSHSCYRNLHRIADVLASYLPPR